MALAYTGSDRNGIKQGQAQGGASRMWPPGGRGLPSGGAPPGPGQECREGTPGAARPQKVGKPEERPHQQGQSRS